MVMHLFPPCNVVWRKSSGHQPHGGCAIFMSLWEAICCCSAPPPPPAPSRLHLIGHRRAGKVALAVTWQGQSIWADTSGAGTKWERA